MNAKPSRRSPSAAATSTDAARARIRAAGLRCTPARLAVMERLAAAAGPRTHAELAADLAAGARHAGSGYDKATIYRNLVELTEAGLVSRMELGDHVWRFEIKGQAKDGSSTPTSSAPSVAGCPVSTGSTWRSPRNSPSRPRVVAPPAVVVVTRATIGSDR
jgi:Fur family ferric uptake transcriptional regulator